MRTMEQEKDFKIKQRNAISLQSRINLARVSLKTKTAVKMKACQTIR